MRIEQKLKLSYSTDMVYFFRDGAFVRLFGVSLYLAITQLELSVKVSRHCYKKLNNRLILRAGYPDLSLKTRYTDLIYYDFGYGLKRDWHFSYDEYQIWQQNHLTLI